jgi:hypothetical protein
MEVLSSTVDKLGPLAGRVVCLEQLVAALARILGEAAVRVAVCKEPRADKALSICFQCTQGAGGKLDPSGLVSYIGDLRRRAATVLVPSDVEIP